MSILIHSKHRIWSSWPLKLPMFDFNSVAPVPKGIDRFGGWHFCCKNPGSVTLAQPYVVPTEIA